MSQTRTVAPCLKKPAICSRSTSTRAFLPKIGNPCGVDLESMEVAVVLIEFASSGLWQNHFRRSNFISQRYHIRGRGPEDCPQIHVQQNNRFMAGFSRHTHSDHRGYQEP